MIISIINKVTLWNSTETVGFSIIFFSADSIKSFINIIIRAYDKKFTFRYFDREPHWPEANSKTTHGNQLHDLFSKHVCGIFTDSTKKGLYISQYLLKPLTEQKRTHTHTHENVVVMMETRHQQQINRNKMLIIVEKHTKLENRGSNY